jgi:hypothetical protein
MVGNVNGSGNRGGGTPVFSLIILVAIIMFIIWCIL